MASRSLTGLRTIVTGASSGIGRAICIELARHGGRVLAVARREDRLRELSQEIERLREPGSAQTASTSLPQCEILVGDVTDTATRAAAVELARSAFGGLDALVNNAGIGTKGAFADDGEAALRRVMEVNFFAAAEWTRATLPLLGESRAGIVVNIGSVLGYVATPRYVEYVSSKYAVRGLSDALRLELASRGIDVLHVAPSTTESEFFNVLLAGTPQDRAPRRRSMTAEAVARRVVRAMEDGRREIVLSAGGKLLVLASRLFPRLTEWAIRRSIK